MKLLIDIGNSRIKLALTNQQDHLQQQKSIMHDIDMCSQYIQELYTSVTIDDAGVVSVASEELYKTVIDTLNNIGIQRVTRIQSASNYERLRNAYHDPAQLGADRWVALIAGYTLYEAPLLICDCGTAMTIDLLADNGVHAGGYIMPGLQMARQALHTGTQQLPLSRGENIRAANNTEDAILAGTVLQVVAAIEAQVASFKPVTTLLTGGEAESIGRYLSVPFHLEPDLVLKGLAIAAKNR